MILVKKIINCKLSIDRIVENDKDTFVCEGKGYYRCINDEVVVFFSSGDIKYKYVYKEGYLTVFCNNSKYIFKENEKKFGEIKNGDYIFKITTLASKIEINSNSIILNYSLYQDDLVGTYFSVLSFN